MSEVLIAENVTFRYGKRTVVEGLSLTARAGEVIGIIGPNGAGKSTLIKGLAGVLAPARGRVLMRLMAHDKRGRFRQARRGACSNVPCDIRTISRDEVARIVAVVPQSPSLPDSFTALEIVQMGRTPHLGFLQSEGAHDWTAIWRAMELTDTVSLAEQRVGELSGGERQRVVIARALAQQPSLLLLDEPTTHLDLAHQIAVLDLVHRLQAQCELTVLAVFHDLNLAAQYCPRLIMLHRGQIWADGPPKDVITSHNIHQVYGALVDVLPNPHNGLPITIPAMPGDGQVLVQSLQRFGT